METARILRLKSFPVIYIGPFGVYLFTVYNLVASYLVVVSGSLLKTLGISVQLIELQG